MGTISACIPDDLDAELETYLEAENLDQSAAVRKLLTEALSDWRRDRALDQLARGQVTLTRAADIAAMPIWEFAQLAEQRDVISVSGDHLESDLETI